MTNKQQERLRELTAAQIAYMTQLSAEQQQEAFIYVVHLMEYTLSRLEKKKPLPNNDF